MGAPQYELIPLYVTTEERELIELNRSKDRKGVDFFAALFDILSARRRLADETPAPMPTAEMPNPLEALGWTATEERVGWAIVQGLHEHVPEGERPKGWADLNETQLVRIQAAARLVIRQPSALKARPVPPEHDWQPDPKSRNAAIVCMTCRHLKRDGIGPCQGSPQERWQAWAKDAKPIDSAPRDGTILELWAEDADGPFLMSWDPAMVNPLMRQTAGIWVSMYQGLPFTWDEQSGAGPTHWKPARYADHTHALSRRLQ